jgi:hypothetical protein
MPRKSKPRNPVPPLNEVWIAPRPVNQPAPRAFEPTGAVPSNRYLEFADVALGVKKTSFGKKKRKPLSAAGIAQNDQLPDGKVTSISRAKALKNKAPNQGFGAFRSSR